MSEAGRRSATSRALTELRGALAESLPPSDETISALLAGSPDPILPTGWEERDAERRRQVLAVLSAASPTVADVLSRVRKAVHLSQSQMAAAFGIEPQVIGRLEEGRAGQAILNLKPEVLRTLATQAGVSVETVALAAAQAVRAAAGYGFAYEPRVAEPQAAAIVESSDLDRLVLWIQRLLG
jgi:transcriptional regulator with XRE-family HTH domain